MLPIKVKIIRSFVDEIFNIKSNLKNVIQNKDFTSYLKINERNSTFIHVAVRAVWNNNKIQS